MSGPVISPDGKWLWTGSEWIPAPPSTESIKEKNGLKYSVAQTTPKNSKSRVKIAAICIVGLVLSIMLFGGHSGQISYSASGSYSATVWFNGGSTMDAEDIEIKAIADGRIDLCKNSNYENTIGADCSYYLTGDWEQGEELMVFPDCLYIRANYCNVQLEIRYNGFLLSGSNKEITLYR